MKIFIIIFGVLISSVAVANQVQLRDPTRPPGVSAMYETSPMREFVSSIIISGDRKIAYIGDEHVTIGDTVKGMKVVDITPHEVILKSNSREIKIPLSIQQVKSSVKEEAKK